MWKRVVFVAVFWHILQKNLLMWTFWFFPFGVFWIRNAHFYGNGNATKDVFVFRELSESPPRSSGSLVSSWFSEGGGVLSSSRTPPCSPGLTPLSSPKPRKSHPQVNKTLSSSLQLIWARVWVEPVNLESDSNCFLGCEIKSRRWFGNNKRFSGSAAAWPPSDRLLSFWCLQHCFLEHLFIANDIKRDIPEKLSITSAEKRETMVCSSLDGGACSVRTFRTEQNVG